MFYRKLLQLDSAAIHDSDRQFIQRLARDPRPTWELHRDLQWIACRTKQESLAVDAFRLADLIESTLTQ